jgi:uncharacterized protein (DUF486 family)
VSTIILLPLSNVFMTFAWYGHLKYGHAWPVWKAILISWGIALFEYCLAVPANRVGYGEFSGFQLKIIQEIVTLIVFLAFALTFLKEKLSWNSSSVRASRRSPRLLGTSGARLTPIKKHRRWTTTSKWRDSAST